MKYLTYNTKDDALSRSQEIAIEQGCTNSITSHWFGVIEHPTTLEGAMQIPDGEESKLTDIEINNLKDYSYMENDGWFIQDNPIN